MTTTTTYQPIEELPPGTDLTAVIWKTLQSTQIQTQLDQSHNLYDIEKLQTENSRNKDKFKNYHSDYDYVMADIDKDLTKIKETSKKRRDHSIRVLENLYLPKIRNVYNQIYSILSSRSMETKEMKSLSELEIKNVIFDALLQSPTLNEDNQRSVIDSAWLANLGNFMDIRKNKEWVSYVLSDFVPRQGPIHPHPIYNNIPGWLFDAVQISGEKKLSLIYATDMRGVSEWMGQFCSLINLHNLFSVNLENQQDLNCTAILIHLVGILSTRPLNSINRQGMYFPDNVLQKTTFENVKNLLSKVNGSDNLSSFISSTIACLPHKTGTNSFDLSVNCDEN